MAAVGEDARHVRSAETMTCRMGCRAIEIVRMLRPDLDAEAELQVIEDMEVDGHGRAVGAGGSEGRCWSGLPQEHWAVVTSCYGASVLGRLAAAGFRCRRIYYGGRVERGKPDPEPYRRGAHLIGLRPEDCVVMEDAASGVEAGMRRDVGCWRCWGRTRHGKFGCG